MNFVYQLEHHHNQKWLNQIFEFSESTAISAILPAVKAGPTDLNFKPDKLTFAKSDLGSLFFFWDKIEIETQIVNNKIVAFFIGIIFGYAN